jgi:hypothetical protein
MAERAKAAKAENYPAEVLARVLGDYQSGIPVETIADSIGKSVRSVRSKLVREGVYIAAPKAAKAKREEGPTKKELLRDLEALAPFPVDGFVNATKEAIAAMIAHLETEADAPAEDAA